MDTTALNRAIDNEFTCYYQIDELPGPWNEEVLSTELPRRAWKSAVRLRQAVGEANVPALVQMLSDMQRDPGHPMVSMIGGYTRFIWTDDPEDWRVFQLLMELIITNLSKKSSDSAT